MDERKKNFFDDFRRSAKADWIQRAGAGNINWQDLELDSYYDQHDLANKPDLRLYHNRLYFKEKPTGAIRYWANLQKIHVKDPTLANRQALEALNNGADGIIFDLTNLRTVSFPGLLKNILIDYCSISFISKKDPHLEAYCDFIGTTEVDPMTVSGTFFMDSTPIQDLLQAFEQTINYPDLKVFTISSNNHRATENIAEILAQASSILEEVIKEYDAEQVLPKINVTVTLSTDYFGDIAKIRAMRMLLFQLFRAYGYESCNPEDLSIHCTSSVWMEEDYQPHANMLKATTAAMAAIVGGCDSLMVEPEDAENPLMVNVARNVSTILKEESYLDKTADPVAGSYYIESLTDQLAQKAWHIFQNRI